MHLEQTEMEKLQKEVIDEEKVEKATKEVPTWLGLEVRREKVEVQLVPIDIKILLGGSTP